MEKNEKMEKKEASTEYSTATAQKNFLKKNVTRNRAAIEIKKKNKTLDPNGRTRPSGVLLVWCVVVVCGACEVWCVV